VRSYPSLLRSRSLTSSRQRAPTLPFFVLIWTLLHTIHLYSSTVGSHASSSSVHDGSYFFKSSELANISSTIATHDTFTYRLLSITLASCLLPSAPSAIHQIIQAPMPN
jgi:hypothetical protein